MVQVARASVHRARSIVKVDRATGHQCPGLVLLAHSLVQQIIMDFSGNHSVSKRLFEYGGLDCYAKTSVLCVLTEVVTGVGAYLYYQRVEK